MKNERFVQALSIAFTVFVISNIAYTLLTIPLLTVTDAEIWYMSAFFALCGSALLGFPPFLYCLWRVCGPGSARSEDDFRRAVFVYAVVCSVTAATVVTILCIAAFGIRHFDAPMLLMSIAGALSPLPALLILRKPIARIYHQLKANTHEVPVHHP
jgi:hypothetical protein